MLRRAKGSGAMSLLTIDPSLGVWLTTDSGEPLRRVECALSSPDLGCVSGEGIAVASCRERNCVCLIRRGFREIARMPAPPGVSAMCLSPCGRYLYQLSAEADCVHTRLVATGELQFATPTGVFPRCMRMDADGKRLLVAGGAMDEAYLLGAPELTRVKTIHTRCACFAADFWQEGLLLVCAREGEDIQTAVYTLSPRGVRPREVITLPGQPGGLCVCPDGRTALLSTRDGLMRLDIAAGELLWNLPEWPLCMHICCRGDAALISGTLGGEVCLLSISEPWQRRVLFRGTEPHACFLPIHGIISAPSAHP